MSKKEGTEKKNSAGYITVVVILCVILAALIALATLATLGYIGTSSSEDETTELEDSDTTTEDLEDEDEEDDEEDNRHQHAYQVEETKTATCTEKGLLTYTCSCGDTYTVETPALGHDLGETYFDEESNLWLRACQREGCTYTVEVNSPITHTHDFVISDETEATCTEKGSITYTCTCGDTYSVETPVLGHDLGEAYYDETTEAWVRACQRENCTYTETVDNPNTHVHTFEKVTIAATCVADGKEIYTCSCGVSYVVVLPADPDAHSWTKLTPYEETGLWERHCELCSKQEVVRLADLSKDELAETVIEPTTAEQLLDSVVDGATVEVNTEITIPADSTDEKYKDGKGSGLVIHEGIDYTLILGEDATLTNDDSYHSNSNNSSDDQYVATIYVCKGGSITIEGSGTVNVSTYGQYCLYVDDGGNATINGGTFEQGYHVGDIYASGKVQNPTYTIYNLGNLTINDGDFIAENVNSSLIMNGRQEEFVSERNQYSTAILTINGGSFIGGKHVIKNCLDGVLTITGGEITGINWAESAKTCDNSPTGSGYVPDPDTAKNSADIIYDLGGTVFISGGTFGTAENPEYDVIMTVKVYTAGDSVNFDSSVTITGGTFYAGEKGSFTFDFDSVDNASEEAPHESIRISKEIYETYGETLFGDYTLTDQEDGTYSVTPKAS